MLSSLFSDTQSVSSTYLFTGSKYLIERCILLSKSCKRVCDTVVDVCIYVHIYILENPYMYGDKCMCVYNMNLSSIINWAYTPKGQNRQRSGCLVHTYTQNNIYLVPTCATGLCESAILDEDSVLQI